MTVFFALIQKKYSNLFWTKIQFLLVLKLEGELSIGINYDKYEKDNKWNGLKGYITNSKLSGNQIIENYANLWYIEMAFRMSKTDLRIQSIYHHLQRRI